MKKIGNNLRDLLSRQPETVIRGTTLYYFKDKFQINPFTREETLSAYKRVLETIKSLV